MMHMTQQFVSEKVKSLCFLDNLTVDQRSGQEQVLPSLAVGGWDTTDDSHNTIKLQQPIVTTPEEDAIHREFAKRSPPSDRVHLQTIAEIKHIGDTNALRFVSSSITGNMLYSASSSGSIHAFQLTSDSHSIASKDVSTGSTWEQLFARSATCLDVSKHTTTLVAGSENGQVAWLRLDDNNSVVHINNRDSSQLAIHGIKCLTDDSMVATVGAAIGSQLRLWDCRVNLQCPVITACATQPSSVLCSIETHPTRPELLITGDQGGYVAFWDQRRLGTPLRIEEGVDSTKSRTIRSLILHPRAPRLLFSCGDDAAVLRWDFKSDTYALREYEMGASIDVCQLVNGFLPWRAMALDVASDTLVAGSDAQSLVIIQHVSSTIPSP